MYINTIGDPPSKLSKPPERSFDYTWNYHGITKEFRAIYAFELEGPGDGEEHVYRIEMKFGDNDWRFDGWLCYCTSWKCNDCSIMDVDTEGVLGAAFDKIYELQGGR